MGVGWGGVGVGHFYVFTFLHVSEHSEHICLIVFLWENLIIFTEFSANGWGTPHP